MPEKFQPVSSHLTLKEREEARSLRSVDLSDAEIGDRRNALADVNLVWFLLKMSQTDIMSAEDDSTSQHVPTWTAFFELYSGKQAPKTTIGYALYMYPQTPTNPDIVKTSLDYFVSMNLKLDPEYWNKNAQNTLNDILSTKPNTNVAKNVIMFLGDGMGISTITAARIYKGQKNNQTGEESFLSWDKFKDTALLKTYNVDKQVPDSAGTAVAFLSGVKSNAWVLGVDAKAKKGDCLSSKGAEIDSIATWFQKENKATGFVTTSRITHASPAGLYANIPHRDWESDDKIPMDQRPYNCKDIARQLIEDDPGRNLKVILGGGRRHFFPNTTLDKKSNKANVRTDGRNLVEEWMSDKAKKNSKYSYVTNLEEFNKVDLKTTDYLLGLFEHSNMNYELNRDTSPKGEPSLREMTIKAIEMLSKEPNGYFLFVEAIYRLCDKQNTEFVHVLVLTMLITKIWQYMPWKRHISLTKAVQAALDRVNTDETLIVVTADHAHSVKITGSQNRGTNILGIAENSVADGLPYTTILYSSGPGYVSNGTAARQKLANNFTIDKNYEYMATVPRNWSAHGGEDIQVAAYGPMSHLFRGVQEQNYVAHVMAYASCVGRNKNHCQNASSGGARISHRIEGVKAEIAGTMGGFGLLVSLPEKFLVVTVATEETDGYLRFQRSAEKYGISVKVLGMGEKWNGGDVKRSVGGGHKVNLLRKGIAKYAKSEDLIIMFIDSYDVVFSANQSTIIEAFLNAKSKIVFSAEEYCWPDKSLAPQYPKGETGSDQLYLNSGDNQLDILNISGFMGYAPEIVKMISNGEIEDQDDDQLFYTRIYLNQELREELSISLDHKSRIFQCLHGAVNDMELRFSEEDAYLRNMAHDTHPLIIHGNGGSKLALNSFGNYLAKSWHPETGCSICKENTISLQDKKDEDLPTVLLGIFVLHPTSFFPEFLERISKLNYPKTKIDLFFYNGAKYHVKEVADFLKKYQDQYRSSHILSFEDLGEEGARDQAIERSQSLKSDYFFSVDSEAMLTNPNVLRSLIEQNRKVLAPLLVRPFKLWSNFWGALSSEGYYSRSFDYLAIVQDERKGAWNVPYMHTCYLIQGSFLQSENFNLKYQSEEIEKDLVFSYYMRDNGHFMYISNLESYGHLTDSDNFDTKRLHPNLFLMFENRVDWEARYIHENYSKYTEENADVEQPCPDVYWFPIVSELFCNQIVEELEAFGKWSDGTNSDPRLANGYENVPTRDIHMNQIGLEKQWLHFLREFIRPMQEKLFPGYFHDPPQALLNFVVRYRPDEQPALRPHHDTSTYTMNLALNRPGIDFQGGGCRFVRYNCSVTQTRKGWAFIHPGRLTHYHEGLETTAGTRYIFVSFIDP
ncbi:Procollagen-lysine,2-oxoglutarate 5-dioxygenase 3 [Nymphon striatum]|nr:Procollagen-lysine,2-oxoglutarate 5-dioxygenase 3 [Nymphon striatum]